MRQIRFLGHGSSGELIMKITLSMGTFQLVCLFSNCNVFVTNFKPKKELIITKKIRETVVAKLSFYLEEYDFIFNPYGNIFQQRNTVKTRSYRHKLLKKFSSTEE